MKLFNLFLALLLSTILASCSSGKSSNEADDQSEDSVALEDENEYDSEDSINEDSYSSDTIEEQDDEVAENIPDEAPEPEEPYQESQPTYNTQNGDLSDYTVEKGDTLMLVAYKLYGDYSKWREIREQNPQLGSSNDLTQGQNLKVVMPDEKYSYRPDGLPYLIKRSDTLQTISNDVYKTTRKWMDIYKHNKPLIKNPNIIYAGFTLYYLEDGNYNRLPASN
jgi:nucleoid-associated protein YgaU